MRCSVHVSPVSLTCALLLLGSCGTQVAPEAIPYHFRQSMIDPGAPQAEVSPGRGEVEAQRLKRPRRPRRRRSCSRLEGRRIRGRHRQAVAAMLRACLGRTITLAEIARDDDAVRNTDPNERDLVLFHNTRDNNGNRKLDDRFSDAGVVVKVRGSRVTFIYVRRGHVRLGILNLKAPSRRRLARKGRVENTFIRVKLPADPPGTRYLAGQLLAGFTTGGGSDS